MNSAPLMDFSRHRGGGLAAEAAALGPWFHNLHLPDGTQTAPDHPLGDFPAFKWLELAALLPDDLSGWTALDVGANAGYYSLELARRGARVVSLDREDLFLRQARWAKEQFPFGDRIELRRGQVYDVAHWGECFDLVLFLGVFYHLRYPLLALDVLAASTRRLFAFQTLTMPGQEVMEAPDDQDFHDRVRMTQPGWPKMAFIEKKFAGDATNWWAANHACVEALLRSTGLRVIARPGTEMYLCEPAGSGGAASARTWDADEMRAACGLRPEDYPHR
jgi:tRNA (mo5U34)-methyltransferase